MHSSSGWKSIIAPREHNKIISGYFAISILSFPLESALSLKKLYHKEENKARQQKEPNYWFGSFCC